MDYDEFGLLSENAREFDIPWHGRPAVQRTSVTVADGRRVSALQWGDEAPEIVLLHGGAQNAHTWDTVVLALGRPVLAIDLPGHGHSDHRADHRYFPQDNAEAVVATIQALAPSPTLVVGMSLGGLSAIACHAAAPDLVRSLLLVDVTPGVDHEKSSAIVQFIDGPESFESFDEILERTIQFNPTRSVASLRRGVMHNARERPDGRWEWRYDLPRRGSGDGAQGALMPGLDELWDTIEAHDAPLLLARGSESPVVSDEDVAELSRRRPDAEIVVVEGAGHSIQGDRPLELAQIIASRVGA